MADVDSALRQWSTTASNNKPTGATSIGSGLDDNMRQIQATVRQYFASVGTTIASAATVDLSTADGKTIPISGTSTVTGMGTEVAGLEYLLTTTGAQVWKHSSSLMLPGAADITTASGDYALVQSKGSGNWVVPFFTKASGQPVIAGSAGAGISVVGAATSLDINKLTTDNSVVGSDYLPFFDSSESAGNKATIASILAGVAATQTEMESYTSNSVVATPGNVNWHPGMAKAWVNFSGSGSATVAMNASYNVSSVTRTAAGKYTVNFITAFSSANYIPSGIVGGGAAGQIAGITLDATATPKTTTAAKFSIYNTSLNNADPATADIVFFGDQ